MVRQRALGHYFGASAAADAFMAAIRIPNLLQNLFGEGVLSASFIPVYARLLGQDREDEARNVAGAVAAVLGVVIACLVLVGILASPLLVDLIAPGFSGAQRLQTIRLVRIFFPGMGLLVLSAWCLGILNSHGRFFLSYAAPVVWNVAIIAALVAFGGRVQAYDLAAVTAWGAVVGSGLQFAIQLPTVLSLAGAIRLRARWATDHVRTVVRNFFPVFLGRGVLQISAYIDTFLGSLLPAGAVASLAYAQTLYLLPVSLFGMSVAAAELPALSRLQHGEAAAEEAIRERLGSGLGRVSFLIIPSAVAFLAFGDVIAGAVYLSGRFTPEVARYVWGILGGAALGLLAMTQSRLYSSGFYAIQDTRTPVRYSIVRVVVAIVLGWFAATRVPDLAGLEARWGAVGITLAASIAAWVEWILLRRAFPYAVGDRGPSAGMVLGLTGIAGAAAGLGWLLRAPLATIHPIPFAIIVLGVYGSCYMGLAWLFRIPQARAVLRRP